MFIVDYLLKFKSTTETNKLCVYVMDILGYKVGFATDDVIGS